MAVVNFRSEEMGTSKVVDQHPCLFPRLLAHPRPRYPSLPLSGPFPTSVDLPSLSAPFHGPLSLPSQHIPPLVSNRPPRLSPCLFMALARPLLPTFPGIRRKFPTLPAL